MEGVANSVEDRLVDGLSFQLKPGASYVTERKSVTFHPQGSNIYSTNGTKLIKLLLTGDQWLDPSTFRIMFELQNNENPANGNGHMQLRPLGGPHTFFRRMRILCGGQVVEDIDNYNRVHQMFTILNAKDANINERAEAFGQQFDNHQTTFDRNNVTGINPGEAQTVLFKPCSGLFNQPKMLPIRYMPITIELELVHDNTEPIVSATTVGVNNFDVSTDASGNTSLLWQIMNVQVKCDVVTLDNQLDNSYAEHLLSGKPLPINYQTYVSQKQSILSGNNGSQKVRLNVTRALTRLKNVFITLDQPATGTSAVKYKDWNSFYSPMEFYTGDPINSWAADGEIADFQVQIGSKLFPEYPIRSHAEAYYQLRKTLGKHDQHNSFDITQHEYRCRKFIMGIDMEKVLEAGYTGINTRAGDLMNIRFDHATPDADKWAQSLHIVLTSDQILEVRDSGVQVFD